MSHSIVRGAALRITLAALLCVGTFFTPTTADASCCKGTTCTDDNLIVCAISGGNWLPGPCIPLVTCAIAGGTSACCNPLIGCVPSPENLCFGQFMEGLACDDIDSCRDLPPPGACCGLINQCKNTIEDGCDGFGETFIEGDTCDDANCGLLGASGACCTALGGCLEMPTSAGCIGGSFRAGRTCEEVDHCAPPEVMGACCDGGTCIETSESSCDANGGIFAANAACEDDLCAVEEPEGACCIGEGRCADVREEDCVSGEFHADLACADDDALCDVVAPPEEGACCAQGNCEITTHAACNAHGGSYDADVSACEDIVCAAPPAEGACCASSGCTQTTEDACTDGTWNEGESCGASGVCAPPEVACCDAAFQCDVMDEERCENSGGTVVGDVCDTDICGTPPGACCVDEQATDDSAAECKGSFVDDVTPETVDCTGRGLLGACCLGNGVCETSTRNACDFEGGSWSRGASCDEDSACHVPQPRGACCEENSCREVREDACDGEFYAEDACSQERCGFEETHGACCTGSACSVTNETECLDDLGGTFAPEAACDDLADVCPGAVRGACCADGQCTEQAKATCERNGGAFHAGAGCDDSALCTDVSDDAPVDAPDPDVALTGGRLFSCASTQNSPAGYGGLLLVCAALGMLRHRRRHVNA